MQWTVKYHNASLEEFEEVLVEAETSEEAQTLFRRLLPYNIVHIEAEDGPLHLNTGQGWIVKT